VLGGVTALMVMSVKAFLGRTKLYGSVPVEMMATYWHFVDLLWIYLLVFFIWVG
jgi:cytochrome c oxidase subunit 3